VLEGITIRNGSVTGAGGAILCAGGSSPTIRSCVLRENSAHGGSGGDGGALSCSASSPILTGCVFLHNTAEDQGGAVFCDAASQPSLTGCTFFDNGAASGGGLWVSGDSSTDPDHCILSFASAGGAVGCGGSFLGGLQCCDIYGNTGGDWTGCIADQAGINGNLSEDPLFCDPQADNLHLQPESPCAPGNNPECGLIGALDPGCAFYVVAPDGSGDFPTIQAALDASLSGDIIELLDGTYTGDGNRDLDFNGKNITLRSQSGNPHSCVIDCQGGPGASHRGFRFDSGEGPEATLQGLTVTGGYMAVYSGGAIWFSNGSSPTITACIFNNNQSLASGGALYCASQASPAVSSCTFHHNAAVNGGGLFVSDAAPVIQGCTFAHNTADIGGAGISSYSGNFTVENTIIAYGMNGGGVSCWSATVTLNCCDVFGNVGGDFTGCLSGQEGINGNICMDPLFCDPDNGNYNLIATSPCSAFSEPNVECPQIGAWPVNCDLTSVGDAGLPAAGLHLAPAVPNPFARSTSLSYSVAGTARVRLSVYDPAGRLVRRLVDGQLPAGTHLAVWDGRNDAGEAAAAGIYFVRLQGGDREQAERVVYLR